MPAADALFAALVCRATRDLMYLRIDRRAAGEKDVGLRGKRFATPDRAVVCSVSRLEWTLSLSSLPGGAPGWGAARGPFDPEFGRQQSVCDRIARSGQLPVLRWAAANGHSLDRDSTCAAAAAAGKLEMLQWLVPSVLANLADDEYLPSAVIEHSARGGHLAVVKWMWEADGFRVDAGEWYGAAAEGGQLEVLKYLRANCADYLSEEKCDWDNST
eukprot:SAG22_NODE_7545_length_729_cov_3.096825_1_plen_214_part_10